MSIGVQTGVAFGLVILFCGCAQEPGFTETLPDSSPGGVALVERLTGTWASASHLRTTCPSDASVHPFSGVSRWKGEGARLEIVSPDRSVEPLHFNAVDGDSARRERHLRFRGCEADILQELRIIDLTQTRLVGEYTMNVRWTDRPECTSLVQEYGDGIVHPCVASVHFESVKVSVDGEESNPTF